MPMTRLMSVCNSFKCVLFHFPEATSSHQTWYVSTSGYQHVPCGKSVLYPCRDLAHVISIAKDNDIIYINGLPAPRNDNLFSLCHQGEFNLGVHLQGKSLHFIGQHSRPNLGCGGLHYPQWNANTSNVRDLQAPSPHMEAPSSYKAHTPQTKCIVTLHHLHIEDGIIPFANCTVEIENVTFRNASMRTSSPCHFLDLSISHSSMVGGQECDESGTCIHHKLHTISCMNTYMYVTQSTFNQTRLVVASGNTTNITVANCLFSNMPSGIQYLGGLRLTIASILANIHIYNSTFEHQVNPTKLQSALNLFDSALFLKVLDIVSSQTNASAIVENCQFKNNERGIITIGPFADLRIEKCSFTNNIALYHGAGIYVSVSHTTLMKINNSTFLNNHAGKFRDNYPIKDMPNAIEVVNNAVHLDASCCKGVIRDLGKGGGIRISKGRVLISNSTFINNTASNLGGSILVNKHCNLIAIHTYFENMPSHDHALQGDILYSDGIMVINNVKIIVKSAYNGISIFRHSGDNWSLDITNVWMQCPIGYNLRATNSSSYAVLSVGLKRSHRWNQLSYFCQACPRYKYSLDYGYLNNTKLFHKPFVTLLINGTAPKPQHVAGNYEHHNIECSDCPYGGHCEQGISAKRNFWGYIHEGVVKFQHCPTDYCCHSSKCAGISSCENKREGTLCGRCPKAHAEALFSSICVENDKCGPQWLWPFGIAVGFVYAIFLVFQGDLEEFLVSKPPGFSGMTKCFKWSNQTVNINDVVSLGTTTDVVKCVCVKSSPQSSLEIEDAGEVLHLHNHVKSVATSIAKPLKPESQERESKMNDTSGFQVMKCGSGFLVCMLYYYQDTDLMNVQSFYAAKESKGQQVVESILSGIFKFQLNLFQLTEQVCVVSDMNAVQKKIIKAFYAPYVISLFAAMYVGHKCVLFAKKTIQSIHNRSLQEHCRPDVCRPSTKKTFDIRLSSGFILALLLMYQNIGTTTFTLLHCVPVKGDQVLYIDGTIKCYEYWQYVVMAYSMGSVIPFFIVISLGPVLLDTGHTSLPVFFIACLIPLPILVVWLVQAIMWKIRKRPTSNHLSPNVKAVLQVLQGPFKENKYGVCWSGILVGRRLVLILLYILVEDSLVRLLCMLFTCFIILMHHLYAQPYKDCCGNIAGTLSATSLVILSAINVVHAGFEAAEYIPTGPNAFLIRVLNEIEHGLLMWIPLAIFSFFALIFVIQCVSFIVARCFFHAHQSASKDSGTTEDGSVTPNITATSRLRQIATDECPVSL